MSSKRLDQYKNMCQSSTFVRKVELRRDLAAKARVQRRSDIINKYRKSQHVYHIDKREDVVALESWLLDMDAYIQKNKNAVITLYQTRPAWGNYTRTIKLTVPESKIYPVWSIVEDPADPEPYRKCFTGYGFVNYVVLFLYRSDEPTHDVFSFSDFQ